MLGDNDKKGNGAWWKTLVNNSNLDEHVIIPWEYQGRWKESWKQKYWKWRIKNKDQIGSGLEKRRASRISVTLEEVVSKAVTQSAHGFSNVGETTLWLNNIRSVNKV